MKKILLPIFMIIFVIGGGVAGDFFKNRSSDNAVESTDKLEKKTKKTDGHGIEKSSHKKDKKAKKNKGHDKDKGNHGGASYDFDEISYLKFKRQFVVPVMTHGKIDALVIMNLNLELNENAPENAYSLEPKLRDAITRELLALSNAGVFGENLTSSESYETVRSTLLSACEAILPKGIKDILILDIARQEQ